MLRAWLIVLVMALCALPRSASAACEVRDFLAMPLPAGSGQSPIGLALELAYPGVDVDEARNTVNVAGTVLPLGDDPGRHPKARLATSSIREMFTQAYPLSFDLSQRATPWIDPGRARNDTLLKALYGQSQSAVSANLAQVEYLGSGARARFVANTRQCVAQQLQAALIAIAAEGTRMDPFFSTVGGSFNWRVIAGTNRLSAHSFGIAVDFNTELGGYWRWSGAKEGSVGAYNNRYPEALVRHMERYGFIWGGKWHHFDGMHFEYRPELILYARLVGSPVR